MQTAHRRVQDAQPLVCHVPRLPGRPDAAQPCAQSRYMSTSSSEPHASLHRMHHRKLGSGQHLLPCCVQNPCEVQETL